MVRRTDISQAAQSLRTQQRLALKNLQGAIDLQQVGESVQAGEGIVFGDGHIAVDVSEAIQPVEVHEHVVVADVEVVATAADSLRLAFAAVRPGGEVEVMRLDFKTTLFGMGAVLQAALQNSADGGDAWQRVDPGDALGDLLTEVEVRPRIFTPNGDGINDEAVFAFKVVRLSDDSPVEVAIYDLSGRAVQKLVERRSISTGEYAIGWDGRDASGGQVPPGIYYVRLKLAADKGGVSTSKTEVLRMVSVAY